MTTGNDRSIKQSNGSKETLTPSQPSSLLAAKKAVALVPILQRLCSSKNTVQLTSHQVETWLAALSVFDQKIVNAAIINIAFSDDPFPDLGKIVLRCEALRRGQSGSVSQGEVKLGTATTKALAKAWGVEI